MLAAALLLAQDYAEQNLDVGHWSTGNIAFSCVADGLPTMGIWYEPGYKVMDYNEVRTGIDFVLKEPVQSVRFSSQKGVQRWTVVAEGTASQAHGVPNGTHVSIHLNLEGSDERGMFASWELKAGSYTNNSSQCGPIPKRPRMLDQTK